LKERFASQNEKRLFSNQPNLGIDGHRNGGSEPLMEHLNVFLDEAFSQLLHDYKNNKR
jgi:hypothetical protein